MLHENGVQPLPGDKNAERIGSQDPRLETAGDFLQARFKPAPAAPVSPKPPATIIRKGIFLTAQASAAATAASAPVASRATSMPSGSAAISAKAVYPMICDSRGWTGYSLRRDGIRRSKMMRPMLPSRLLAPMTAMALGLKRRFRSGRFGVILIDILSFFPRRNFGTGD
jgi:hypothetical protein